MKIPLYFSLEVRTARFNILSVCKAIYLTHNIKSCTRNVSMHVPGDTVILFEYFLKNCTELVLPLVPPYSRGVLLSELVLISSNIVK